HRRRSRGSRVPQGSVLHRDDPSHRVGARVVRQDLPGNSSQMACRRGWRMSERAELVSWIRGEVVGPSPPLTEPAVMEMHEREFVDSVSLRRGPVAWRPDPASETEEVLYYERESPHRKYGAGLLHPLAVDIPTTGAAGQADEAALRASDTVGVEIE